MKQKDKYMPEAFPVLFFLLGLAIQSLNFIFGNWISWIVMIDGMFIYFLLYIWFMKELRGKLKSN